MNLNQKKRSGWNNNPSGKKKCLLVMRNTFMLLLAGTLHVSAINSITYSQTVRLSVEVNNTTVGDVLREIEEQSEFYFTYNSSVVNTKRVVSIDMKNRQVNEILDELFAGENIGYSINDKHIVLYKKDVMSLPVVQQGTKRITGTVVDASGVPVIGANVMVKGTSNGTITDMDGKFTLEVSEGAVLEVSYIGYLSQIVKANSKSISITLKEDTQKLDEVVVVGYGTQKKATLTGAVSAINGDQILTTKNENIENMLSGKIPGVRIVQKSSEPGEFNNSFEIRGMGNPLVIVDGVPRDNMNRINPNEIESISVLKDASAAVYGVRAANGVVLITTKKGKNGKIELDYNGSFGWQQASGLPQTGSAIDYMTLMNENAVNNGRGIMYHEEDFAPYINGEKLSTDWADSAIKKFAPQTQHNFSASGNTEKVNYFLNFGYLKQDGFWKSGDLNYERFNIRSNISAQLTEKLKAEVLLGGMMDTKNSPYHDAWYVYKSIWTQVPTWPLYANNNPQYLYNAADADHPISITDADISGYKKRQMKTFQSTFNLVYDVPFVDGLKAKASYSYDYNLWNDKSFEKEYILYTYDIESDVYVSSKAQSPSSVKRSFKEKTSSLLQLSLDYSHTFRENHNVTALVLYEESTTSMDNFYAKRQINLDAVDELFAGNALNQEGSMDDDNLWKFTNKGFVGRLGYDLSSKYIAEFSFRLDGSSKFAKGHQWGFFPVGSIGWRLSEESFIKDNDNWNFVNNLKFRTSYGKMGDDSSSSYQFLSGFNYPSGGYVLDGTYKNALSLRGMANPYITWFTSKMLNIGIDADMWNGLLGFQFDVFQRNRNGLLATRSASLPGTVGASLPQENLEGDLTKGFEIVLMHRNKINEFNYYFSGNFSYARTRWTNKEISTRGNSYRNWRENYTNRYGDLWWGYGYLGQFQSFEQIYSAPIQDSKGNSVLHPGDYAYEDWNEDGVIDDNDIHPIATSGYPKINFGFTLGGDWRGFDMVMVFQGAAMSNVRYPEQLERPLYWNRNGLAMFMDRWHQEDITDPESKWIPGYYPSTDVEESTNYQDSERLVQNANYLRLKSIELGYTIPEKLLSKVGIKRARLYFSGYNLLTFTNIKYLDPEHPSDSYGYLYPLTKTYNVGLNLTF